MKAIINTDGACRGNPGPSGAGVVIRNEHMEVVETFAGYLGVTTNNVAEYQALIEGLGVAQRLGYTELLLRLDSQLVVRQVRGEYHARDPRIVDLLDKARGILQGFEKWDIVHVPRTMNALADKLANDGIDNHQRALTA